MSLVLSTNSRQWKKDNLKLNTTSKGRKNWASRLSQCHSHCQLIQDNEKRTWLQRAEKMSFQTKSVSLVLSTTSRQWAKDNLKLNMTSKGRKKLSFQTKSVSPILSTNSRQWKKDNLKLNTTSNGRKNWASRLRQCHLHCQLIQDNEKG